MNKSKIKVFISPNPYDKNRIYNPYVSNLFESFQKEDNIEVLHSRGIKKLGFLNYILYIFSDITILSWPESLAFSRFRYLYVPYFVFCVLLMKLFNNRVIWIVHNKHPHVGVNALSKFIMCFMARISTVCITHSQKGVEFFNSEFSSVGKCYYIPHPVYSNQLKLGKECQWDYVIWGVIQRRKGIVDFLKYIRTDCYFDNKKILICGSCKDNSYNNEIQELITPNVTYINKFLEDDELDLYIKKSRHILFTYNSSSILCSGALIYSLNFCKPIIAPNSGAFSEMPGIVFCYNSFNDIKKCHCAEVSSSVKSFIQNNSWQDFPTKVLRLLK